MQRAYEPILPPGTRVYLIRHDFSQQQYLDSIKSTDGHDLADILNGVHEMNTARIHTCAELLARELSDHTGSVVTKRSPFLRAVQSFEQVTALLDTENWIDLGEDHAWHELPFGLNEGISLEGQEALADANEFYRVFFKHRRKHYRTEALLAGADIFAKHPMGGRYVDLFMNVRDSLLLTANSMRALQADVLVIFAHGGTNRAAAAALCGLSAPEFSALRNPENCEIWKIVIPNDLFTRPVLQSVSHPGVSMQKLRKATNSKPPVL